MVDQTFQKPKPILGVVELLPLPGSPGWRGKIDEVTARAEQEATTLATGGVDGLILENTHDNPYRTTGIDAAATVAMATLARRVRQFTQLPLGLSVLLNNPETALAIAQSVPVDFIRVPLLAGSLISEAGQLESKLRELLEYRNTLGLKALPPLWVDVSLNHRVPDLDETEAAVERLHKVADAAYRTGLVSAFVLRDNALSGEALAVIKPMLNVPVIIHNSHHATEAVAAQYRQADGLILGHGIRKSGQPLPPVDMSSIEERITFLQQHEQNASV